MAAPPDLTELADTYPNPSNAVFKGGITKFLNYALGLLGASGSAVDARAALGLIIGTNVQAFSALLLSIASGTTPLSSRNRVINGGFQVNQRAVSGSVVLPAGQYGHDRWKAGSSGCTYTFSTSNNVTTITISAGSLMQVIEGVNLQSGTHVLSWSGTAQGRIDSGSYGASGITATASGGSNQTVEFNTGTVGFVQYEPGSTPTTFEHLPISSVLERCQRYFEVGTFSWASYQATGGGYTSTLPFKVQKRASPTMTTSGTSVTNTTGAGLSADVYGISQVGASTTTGIVAFSGTFTAACEL